MTWEDGLTENEALAVARQLLAEFERSAEPEGITAAQSWIRCLEGDQTVDLDDLNANVMQLGETGATSAYELALAFRSWRRRHTQDA